MSDNEYDDLGIAAIWELDPPTPPISPRDHDDDSATSGAAAAAAASSATSSPVEHAPKAASKTGAKQSTAKEPVLAIVKMPSLMELSLRTLSEHPDQIIDLRFVDIHLCEFLLVLCLRRNILDDRLAGVFYASGHPEIQAWLMKNLAWPYNEALAKRMR